MDSSVLLDVLAPSTWRAWSEEHLAAAGDEGEILVNQVVYAEVAAGFATREIGAHAAVAGLPLLTRDPRRVREYFPTVRLIAP